MQHNFCIAQYILCSTGFPGALAHQNQLFEGLAIDRKLARRMSGGPDLQSSANRSGLPAVRWAGLTPNSG